MRMEDADADADMAEIKTSDPVAVDAATAERVRAGLRSLFRRKHEPSREIAWLALDLMKNSNEMIIE